MTHKEDLQRQLQELEAKLLEFREKEEHTAEDVKAANTVCDDIERINEELEADERAERAIANIRRPESAPVGDPGQPSNGEQPEWNSFGEYLQAVARASLPAGGELRGIPTGTIDKRLSWVSPERRSTGLEESTGSLGGFLVTKDYSSELFSKAHQASMVYKKTRQIPVRGNGLKIAGIDEASRADGSRWGGIRIYWLKEGGTKTASYPKFFMVELTLNKLIGLSYATDELLEDASALENIIRQGFQDEFAFKLDDAVINGTGAGQPLGILNAACLVSQTGASSAGTITSGDVVNVYRRMFPGSMGRAEWFTNVDSLDYLMGLNPVGLTTVGTFPGGGPLWVPGGSFAGAPHDMLLGKPIHYIEQCQATGTAGDLIFADWSQYVTITKGGMQSASSIHVQFTTDETAFRFVMRVDGQPLWNSALTPYKGSNTVGPFVTIATRT